MIPRKSLSSDTGRGNSPLWYHKVDLPERVNSASFKLFAGRLCHLSLAQGSSCQADSLDAYLQQREKAGGEA